jgi:hypothetical protein
VRTRVINSLAAVGGGEIAEDSFREPVLASDGSGAFLRVCVREGNSLRSFPRRRDRHPESADGSLSSFPISSAKSKREFARCSSANGSNAFSQCGGDSGSVHGCRTSISLAVRPSHPLANGRARKADAHARPDLAAAERNGFPAFSA